MKTWISSWRCKYCYSNNHIYPRITVRPIDLSYRKHKITFPSNLRPVAIIEVKCSLQCNQNHWLHINNITKQTAFLKIRIIFVISQIIVYRTFVRFWCKQFLTLKILWAKTFIFKHEINYLCIFHLQPNIAIESKQKYCYL